VGNINRADASKEKLSELNPYVGISVENGELTEEFLSKFQVIVVTNTSLNEQIRINQFCHKNGIKFISGDIRGVFSSVFVDFGDNFIVHDINGEPPTTYTIDSITQVNQILIYLKIQNNSLI
jgi:ubiquitin-activating enzyme E1